MTRGHFRGKGLLQPRFRGAWAVSAGCGASAAHQLGTDRLNPLQPCAGLLTATSESSSKIYVDALDENESLTPY
jgi:hypothetical protein